MRAAHSSTNPYTVMSDSERPDQIEGISTDRGPTPGDPELRTVNVAPDLSDTPEVAETSEIAETPGDTTPGTKLDPA